MLQFCFHCSKRCLNKTGWQPQWSPLSIKQHIQNSKKLKAENFYTYFASQKWWKRKHFGTVFAHGHDVNAWPQLVLVWLTWTVLLCFVVKPELAHSHAGTLVLKCAEMHCMHYCMSSRALRLWLEHSNMISRCWNMHFDICSDSN